MIVIVVVIVIEERDDPKASLLIVAKASGFLPKTWKRPSPSSAASGEERLFLKTIGIFLQQLIEYGDNDNDHDNEISIHNESYGVHLLRDSYVSISIKLTPEFRLNW